MPGMMQAAMEAESFLTNSTATSREAHDATEAAEESSARASKGMTAAQAWNLYTSHALSAWNARTYEFAAIIFTATAYPDTLTASSIRGIITTLASICFSSTLGRWIDRHPSRLQSLWTTITTNRVSVMASCAFWYFIVSSDHSISSRALFDDDLPPYLKHLLFIAVLLLGVLEKLSGVGNMLVMERDWVICLAGAPGHAYDLTKLNAVMRRIDLICKLFAPIVISMVVALLGIGLGVILVGGMSAISWGFEVWCARRVWASNDKLWHKEVVLSPTTEASADDRSLLSRFSTIAEQYLASFALYFSTSVWIPSMALSLLHLSVLTYSATLLTYLLNAGFSLNVITIARAFGSVVEVSSTIVTPVGVKALGRAWRHGSHVRRAQVDINDETDTALLEVEDVESDNFIKNTETGLERLGLWGITWQLMNLLPVLMILWSLHPPTSTVSSDVLFQSSPLPSPSPGTTIPLFTFLSLSRLGLWIYDLTTTQLTQTLVLASGINTFSGVENSFINIFELLNYLFALVFSRPDQFRWLVAGSVGAVGIAAVIYAAWVRGVRGHLVHWEKVGRCACGGKG